MSATESGPEISVVIPTRHRHERLARLLASLGRQTLAADRFEVIVVDDGPRPEIEAAVRAAPAELTLHHLARRPAGGPPAAARNTGWRATSSPLVAFIDDDCEASSEWLEELLAAAQEAPGLVIQGPTRPNPADEDARGPLSHTQEIETLGPWYQTCNVAYPRELLEAVGGFDESFRDAGEDVDLAWRTFEAGSGARFAPAAGVFHAITGVGLRGRLRIAARGADTARVYADHPGLRREGTYLRWFRGRSHFRALLALAGALLAVRRPAYLLLALPYARGLAGRTRARGGSPVAVPIEVACDAAEIATAVRGSLRHRIMLL